MNVRDHEAGTANRTDRAEIPYHSAYFGCCNRTVMKRADIAQPKFCPFCGKLQPAPANFTRDCPDCEEEIAVPTSNSFTVGREHHPEVAVPCGVSSVTTNGQPTRESWLPRILEDATNHENLRRIVDKMSSDEVKRALIKLSTPCEVPVAKTGEFDAQAKRLPNSYTHHYTSDQKEK